MSQLKYGSCDQILSSDHKPVFSLFDMFVNRSDPNKMALVRRKILRRIDQENSTDIPKVQLSSTCVRFPNVEYKVHYEQEIVMTNIGEKTLQFNIKPFEEKLWAKINPYEGMLEVNDSVKFSITVILNESEVKTANNDASFMSTVQILSLAGGSDHFVKLT